MLYLTIDTSAAIHVGLCRVEQGEFTEVASLFNPSTRSHAEALTPMIQQIMQEAGQTRADAIVVGVGPGAFTGLRAGIVTARTLGRAWGVPVYGVSSLEVVALAGADTGAQEVLAIVDARRKELYALRARPMGADDVAILEAEHIVKPAELAESLKREPAVLATANAELYADVFAGLQSVAVDLAPAVMVRLAESKLARREAGEDVSLDTEPHYLRRPDVHGGAKPQPQA